MRIYWNRRRAWLGAIITVCLLVNTIFFVQFKSHYKSSPTASVPDSPQRLPNLSIFKGLKPSVMPPLSNEMSRGPGEGAVQYIIDRNDLSDAERVEYDNGFVSNSFNQFASDRISVRRYIPDFRSPWCQRQVYPSNLPKAAVIICFHNEAWSALLRSVHSVIDHSPKDLISEIILVDDFSDKDHLKEPLEIYMSQLPLVKIVRTKRREGLIRARMVGTNSSSSEVLIYLDSHIECTPGWLEPLLERIKQNKMNVAVPVIEIIDDKDLHIKGTEDKYVQVGGFDWSLSFTWHMPPEHDMQRPDAPHSPIKSPTMAGGLFAIHREFFAYLGFYDEAMEVWGGENLELSFKTWMCGGQLETVVCSRVGHIFRPKSPYKWESKRPSPVKFNLVRLAETWMDDYKHIYFDGINHDLGEYGDVSGRKAIRERNKCHSFQWYLDNIYPDLFLPTKSVGSGDVESMAGPHCIDGHYDDKVSVNAVKLYPCHRQGGNQLWFYTSEKEFRKHDACFDANVKPGSVALYPCHGRAGTQLFEYTSNNEIHYGSQCLEASKDFTEILLSPCSGDLRQKWKLSLKPYQPKKSR